MSRCLNPVPHPVTVFHENLDVSLSQSCAAPRDCLRFLLAPKRTRAVTPRPVRKIFRAPSSTLFQIQLA
eukprot:3566622-Rhodomonas_salina.3